MTTEKNRIIVGSEEWLTLPAIGLPLVKARVDSGAKTSALHAFNIRSFSRSGAAWVSYEVHPLQDNRRVIVRFESEVVDKRVVKSSSGLAEKRYIIRTPVTLNGHTWDIEISLTNRDSMGYRMLFGREAMNSRILVDPSASFLCGTHSKESVNKLYGHAPPKFDGLNIGLLASNPELHSNQRIIEAGEERGHRIRFFDINNCFMKLDADNPMIYYRGAKILNDLDAIIPRIKPALTFYGCALVRHFESIGTYSLNSSAAITGSRDKFFSLQLLLQNGLDIPVSGIANSHIDTEDLIELVNGAPMVIKPVSRTQGRGMVLAETRKASESAISAFKSISSNLLVQEYIKEAEGTDLRLFVVDGKVITALQRKAVRASSKTDTLRGSTSSLTKVSAAERKLAVKACKVLGLKVAGVDIIRSERGPLLLSVKSSPGLEQIEETTGKDLAGAMISALEKDMHWTRPLSN
jgi:ribosomal protein S6--L-glutamate ligase